MNLLFKSHQPVITSNGISSDRQQVSLETEGEIPKYLEGSFVRNGPGVYEFENSTYKHAFDPIAVLQKITFNKGGVKYGSQAVECDHYKANQAAGQIVRAELGTYAEESWVTHNPDGSEITDETEIFANRLRFLNQTGYVTDNTNVQTYRIRGEIISVSDALHMNIHEPTMLRKTQSLDIHDAINFPEDVKCTMHSSHGQFDEKNDFYNVVACQCLPGSKHNRYPFPITCYVPYTIPSLSSKPGVSLLESIQFGKPFFNSNTLDFSIHYFHSLSMTKNYIVLPLSSLLWPSRDIVRHTMNAEPMTYALKWDDEVKGEILLISKDTLNVKSHLTVDRAMLLMHTINAYETDTEIVFDSINTENGELGDIYTFDLLRQTGDDLVKMYDYLAPIAQPLRFILPLPSGGARPSLLRGENLFNVAKDNNQWKTFMLGGIEFPIINYEHFSGKKYDHFWGVGFGAIWQDRIYHVQYSTLKRWVWMVKGYHPSEPVFVQDPSRTDEDAGVLLSLVSPLSDESLKVLNFLC